jgi:uncharacterized protein YjbJ (UPF0337 family)
MGPQHAAVGSLTQLPPHRLSAFRPGSRGLTRTISKGARMGTTDKLTGKVKQAVGDLADDPVLRREGRKEERKGEAKEELARTEELADEKAAEVANLERDTARKH